MAGRSVGQIEVTVDANTGRLKGQLTRAGAEAGAAGKEAIEGELEGIEAEIGVDVQSEQLSEVEARIEAALEGISADIGASLDEAEWRTIEARMDAMFGTVQVAVEATVDDTSVVAANAELEELVDEHVTVAVEGDVNEASFVAANAEAEALTDEHIEVGIEADVDDASLVAAQGKLASLGGGGGKAGADAGRSFGEGFGSGWSSWLFDGEKLIVGSIVLLGNDIAIALEGALSAATAVASSAFSAIGGAVGGMIPLVAALAPAIGATVVGFQGMGDAIGAVTKEFSKAVAEGRQFDITTDKIQAAMAGLAPEAQSLVQAFADIFPQLDRLRQSVQGRLFAGLDDTLRTLADTTIPHVGRALNIAADEINSFIRNVAAISGEIDFGQMMARLQPAIDDISHALSALFASIEPLIKAATPAAKELADWFRQGAEELRGMIERGAASGALTKFFNEGIDSLKLWVGLIRNVGDALFTIFQAGKAQGDSFVESLSDIVKRFDDWMESAKGQTALADFFETGRRVMHAMVPVLEGLKGLFENLVSDAAIGRFEDLASALGRVLPFLGQIIDVVGRVGVITNLVEAFARIGEALQPAMPALDRLADALGNVLVGAIDALTPLVEGLGPLIGQVADALTPLGPPLTEIAQRILELVTPVALEALTALAQVITDLSPLVVDLLDAMMPLIEVALQPMITALQLATPLLELLDEILIELKPVFDDLLPVVQLFANYLTLIQTPLRLVGDLAEETGIHLSDLSNPAAVAGAALHNLFTEDIQGSSVIVDQAIAKQEAYAEAIKNLVLAAVAGSDAMAEQERLALRTGENLGGFAVNADTAADAQDYFNSIVQETDADPIDEVSDAMSRSRDAAKDAADAADILRKAWDELFGGAMELSEANDAFAETLNKISEIQQERAKRLTDVAEAEEKVTDAIDSQKDAQAKLNEAQAAEEKDPAEIERLTRARDDANRSVTEAKAGLDTAKKAYNENLTAIRGNTEAAIENRDTIRQGIDEAIDIAAAKVREGASWEEARKSVLKNRDALIEQLVQQGYNEDAVKTYIDTLNLTPGNIRTAIELANREAVAKGLDDISFKIKQMDGKGVTTPVKVTGLEAVMAGLDGIKGTADDITRKTATLAVSTEGVPTTKKELDEVIDKANAIDGKEARMTVSVGFAPGSDVPFNALMTHQHGGLTRYGAFNVGGEAGNEFVRFGQRIGLVRGPTLLSGGVRVTSTVASEKLMRDFIRAAGGGGGGPTKQVINNMSITPTQADPEAVATAVLNRAAALAR